MLGFDVISCLRKDFLDLCLWMRILASIFFRVVDFDDFLRGNLPGVNSLRDMREGCPIALCLM